MVTSSKIRKRSFYAITSVSSLLLVALLGVTLAFPVLAWLPDRVVFELFDVGPDALAHRRHELTIGFLGWMLLLGIVLQLRAPERKHALWLQAATIPIVLSVVEIVTGDFVVAETAPVLLVILLVGLLHPRASDLVRTGRLDPAMAGLSVLAAVPWVVFSVGQVRLQQLAAVGDAHAQAGHWGLMAAFAVLVVIWALIGASTLPGWWITGLLAALVSLAYGVHSLLFPAGASAAAAGWALAAVAWGAVYPVAIWHRRRTDAAQTTHETPLAS